jgi:hypothetical protein
MKAKPVKNTLIAAAGLVANALLGLYPSVAHAAEPAIRPEGPAQAPSAAELNRASLASIEQSYLEVPRACKARGAAFDPVQVDRASAQAELSATAQIHELLGSGVA